MKKSMLILILTALLSACGESENTPEKAEIFTFQTTQITSVTTTEIAEITTVSAEITTFAHQSETTTQTTAVINRRKKKSRKNRKFPNGRRLQRLLKLTMKIMMIFLS